MQSISFSLCNVEQKREIRQDRMSLEMARLFNESYQQQNAPLRWLPSHFVGKWQKTDKESEVMMPKSQVQKIAEELSLEIHRQLFD